jgi:hypothetical protein
METTKGRVVSGARKVVAVAVAALAGGGSLVALSPSPVSAHETSIPIGDAVGEVGELHSGARLCELSGDGAVGWMDIRTGNGGSAILAANEGCTTHQYGDVGGVARYRVGWDQGGGILWSAWKNT